ncbi:MAG: hypothetical protein JO340_12765 [Acidobacteriaceae bacterium]|nr:hypothetical protein [Acidobacteriaceae bacterium]
MRLSIVLFIAAAAISLGVLGARPKANADPAFAQINSIVATLSEITGLAEKHTVAYGRMDKMQLRRFLTKRIKKTLKPEEIQADELALKMFGLVPQDFDLRESTIDLLTEQAAAFYDYGSKKLFLLDDSGLESETTTLAHELAHALADQHFNLGKFMDETPANDDENLAHTAVVEGQASWLMLAYDLKHSGRAPVPTMEMVQSVVDSSETSMADYPVLKNSPLYIQQSLLFPYTQGTLFFDSVYRKMGKPAFAAVFTDAPVDSAQIIHPDRYFRRQKETRPELPKPTLTKQGKEITEGSVGEFDHEMLLRQYAGGEEAEWLAQHLKGGQFAIVTAGAKRRPVLEYVSEWDSEATAAQFFSEYKKVLQAKWKHCEPSMANGATFAGSGDNGYFVTRMAGAVVTSIEGVSELEDWQRLVGTQRTQAAVRVPFATRSAARF